MRTPVDWSSRVRRRIALVLPHHHCGKSVKRRNFEGYPLRAHTDRLIWHTQSPLQAFGNLPERFYTWHTWGIDLAINLQTTSVNRNSAILHAHHRTARAIDFDNQCQLRSAFQTAPTIGRQRELNAMEILAVDPE